MELNVNTNERPLVSFIVIAYNQEEYIEEAIRGAFAQTYEPLEIILSDDNSPDKTFEIMQRLAEEYTGPHKIILNQNNPNLGIGGHINRVMEVSTGEFIVVNAGDDISIPERTTELVNVWQKSGREAKSVCSDCYKMNLEGKVYDILKFNSFDRLSSPLKILELNSHVIGATNAWDREIFDIFGPLNPEVIHEDRILPLRSALIGKVDYVDKPLIKYRDGGISSNYSVTTTNAILYGENITIHKRFYIDYLQKISDLKKMESNSPNAHEYKKLIYIAKSKLAYHEFIVNMGVKKNVKFFNFVKALFQGVSVKKSVAIYLKYQFTFFYGLYLKKEHD